jgi:hypothetical protein
MTMHVTPMTSWSHGEAKNERAGGCAAIAVMGSSSVKHRPLVSGLLPAYWNIFYLVCSISARVNKTFLQIPAMCADVSGCRIAAGGLAHDECCSAALRSVLLALD